MYIVQKNMYIHEKKYVYIQFKLLFSNESIYEESTANEFWWDERRNWNMLPFSFTSEMQTVNLFHVAVIIV